MKKAKEGKVLKWGTIEGVNMQKLHNGWLIGLQVQDRLEGGETKESRNV